MEMIAEQRRLATEPATDHAPGPWRRPAVDRLRGLFETEKDFLILLVLFGAFRLMALVMFRPGGHIVDYNTYYAFFDWARLSDRGLYPYFDFWMEHPPLAPWLAILAYRLSVLIPPWYDQYLWFSLFYGSILLPLEMGNLVLVYLLGRKLWGREIGFRCSWMYAALFVPVLILRSDFDVYPLFFFLLSVYLVVSRRTLLAGLTMGAGFLVKIVPILVLPVALRAFGGKLLPSFLREGDEFPGTAAALRRVAVLLAATAVSVAVLAAPFYFANPATFVASFRNMAARPAWETIWALIDGYYSGGMVAGPGVRLDLASALVFDHQPVHSWSWLLPALVVCYLGVLALRVRWNRPLAIVAGSAIGVSLFLLFSKGYSPQFLIYVLPFAILLFPSFRGVVYAVVLSLVNLLEYPVALVMLPQEHALLAGTVILRTGILLLLSADCLVSLLVSRKAVLADPSRSSLATGLASDQAQAIRTPRWWRLGSGSTLFAAAAVLVGLVLFAGRSYFSASLATEQYREAVTYLQAQPASTILITDQGTYARLYPFLGRQHRVFLVQGAERPADILPPEGAVYLFDGRSASDQQEGPPLERWLAGQAFPAGVKWFANSRVAVYSMAKLAIKDVDEPFDDGISLVGYATEDRARRGGVLPVALRWRSGSRPQTGYSVFVHLVGPDGQIVAQRDSVPANGTAPTSDWTPGLEVQDNYGLSLPDDLNAGQYQLRVGLYDPQTGQRLGTASHQDQILLARIDVN